MSIPDHSTQSRRKSPANGPAHPQTSRQEKWIDTIALLTVNKPWLIIISSLLIVLSIASGARWLEFSNNYRVFFSDENPELTAFEDFQNTYTKNDNILFVIHPKQGTVFTPETMTAVEKLTEQAWQIPFSSRVDSVTNFQHSWAEGDDLTVDNLIRDAHRLTTSEVLQKGEIAWAEPLLNGNILSRDAKTTAINVTLQYPEKSLTEVPSTVAKTRELAAEFRAQNPDIEVYLTGLSMLNNAFAETGQQDAASLMPIMFAVLLLMIFVVLRSVSMIAATLAVIMLSTMTTMGFAGLVGIQLTPISIMAPVIVMTLAIADSIHILMTIIELMRQGKDKISAIVESVHINFQAVTLTSITTMIGFLALNYSDAPPFWHLGNMTAMGIVAAWATSIFTLPAIMRLLPLHIKVRNREQSGNPVIRFTANLVTRHYKPVLYVTVLLSIGLVGLIGKNTIDDSFVSYFDERIEFRTDTEFTMDNLAGIYQVEYSLPAANPGGVSNPEYLQGIAAFTDWLRSQAQVDHVYSYSDIIKRLNKNMHGDNDNWYQLPTDRNLAAQYLLLYELSLPYGLDLNDRINIDKSSSRITVTLGDVSTAQTREFLDHADSWMTGNLPSYMQAQPTGATVMFSYIFKRNTESMLIGNVMAISMITIMLILSLRSWKYGLLSIIPNTIPILITFGIWGFLVGKIGLASASVSATALGIIVDDTVHFLTKYLRARRELGYDQYQAVHYAFKIVGNALLANSVILIAGFAVLALSAFKINGEMGLLTALAIAVALIMDFLLLPALLMIGYKKNAQPEAQLQSPNSEIKVTANNTDVAEPA